MLYNIPATNNNYIREQNVIFSNIAAFVFAMSYLLCLPGRNSVWSVENLKIFFFV
jgi:hypothetical protein